jgi:short-subunit dehydrogenase
MRRDMHDRRVLITGASSGIGKATAEVFAQSGARLALVGRSAERLGAVANRVRAVGGDVTPIVADLAVDVDRARIVDEAVRALGGLDALVNIAGIGSWAHFADPESNESIVRQIMEVNFFAPADLMRRTLPILTEGRDPAIVTVASMCGRRAMPGWSEYSASKFALCGLIESLRAEFARFDVDVLLLNPGLTKSDLPGHLLLAKGRAKIDYDSGMSTRYVAEQVLDSLRRNVTEKTLGREARQVLLVNKFFPRLTDWLLAREMRRLYPES